MPGSASRRSPVLLRLELACDLSQVRPIAVAAHRFLRENGCSENESLDFEMALVEACNNGVQHAVPNARHKPLLLELQCGANSIELHLTDHTAGFDWPEQAPLPEPDAESGRGVYLIQSLMDECRYERGKGANTLILRKTRLRPKAG